MSLPDSVLNPPPARPDITRIVCRGAVTDAVRALPGIASVRDSAPLVELKTGAFDDTPRRAGTEQPRRP